MKILAIGDPHGDLGKIRKIPKKRVDLILLTGDIGKADFARKRYFENVGRKKKGLMELEYDRKAAKIAYNEIYGSTMKVLNYLSEFPVYSIMGNVGNTMVKDYEVKKDEKKYKTKLPYLGRELKKAKNFHLAINRLTRFGRLKIGFLEYFTDNSWIKEFNEKDRKRIKKAKKQTEKARKILKRLGRVDILVCHQPPFGYLDKVSGKYGAPKHYIGKHAGSKAILDYVKRYQPKYVFCGHIHEGEGHARIGKTEIYNLGVAGHKIIEI